MKFACACGHVIRDQTDYLPYKASVLRDEDDERFWDDMAAIAAVGRSTAGASEPGSTLGLGRMRPILAYTTHAYECEACGRLYVERERGAGGELVEFLPASGRPARVLASPRGSPVRRPGEFTPPAG